MSRGPSVLAGRPRDLDAAWATRVLQSADAPAEVSSVELVEVDVGTTTRIKVRVEHDGPPDLARSWFVKLPSGSFKARAITALPRLPQTEVRFYRELSGATLPIRHPRALGAESRFGRGYTLVLEDLTEGGAQPGSPRETLSPARAEAMCAALAGLHAHFWESPRLGQDLAWLAGPIRRLEDGLGSALAVPLMRRGLDRASAVVPSELRRPALRYAGRRRQAMRFLSAGPKTLVHHDCHPGNLYWSEGRPGLLDWQLVRTGEGISDLSYLLAIGLEPGQRAAHEGALVAGYRGALEAQGVEVPSAEALWDRYRAHLVYAFEAMVVTLAVGDLMDEEAVLELIRRAALACAELDAFGALGPAS